MKIDICTLFPEMFAPLFQSVIGRAVQNNLLSIEVINIRDFSTDKHKKVDDYSFGGGKGMIMACQSIVDCIENRDPNHTKKRIYLSPKGKKFDQKIAKSLAKEDEILLLCGHYEGVDQRAIDLVIDEEISIGDYILTGGELPAMIVVDAVARNLQGVLAEGSLDEESFSNNLLEYPQYTRPLVFRGQKVPDVLVSGNHQEVAKWREEQSKIITQKNRPDLLK